MNRVFKSFKYMILDAVRPVIIYYIVIAFVIAFSVLLPVLFPQSNIEVGGFEISTTIFLFVIGLNAFKSVYLFLQANSVTRKHVYIAGVFFLVTITLFMTVIGTVINGLLVDAKVTGRSLMQLLYPNSGFTDGFVWLLAINLLVVLVGWFITLVYYRSSKPLKLVISLSPALLSVLLPIINSLLGGGLLNAPARFFFLAMGLSGTPNAFIGALSMVVMAAITAGFTFLLVRRAPVKEQER